MWKTSEILELCNQLTQVILYLKNIIGNKFEPFLRLNSKAFVDLK